jgi:RimJ/RimL family protein N-acetyltransferase
MNALFGRWARHEKEGSDYHFALCDARGDELCGLLGLRFRGHRERGDLGYWVGLPSQGRGLATEAIRLAARLSFDHLHAEEISAQVFVGNTASRIVLERNGFVLRRTLEQAAWKRGAPVDEWYFDLARADWERRRGAWLPEREEVEVGDPDELAG